MLYLSKQLTPKKKLSRSTGDSIPRTPGASHVPVVKSEPVETNEGLRSPNRGAKIKPEIRFSSPIVISSDESDVSTPKAKKTGPGKKISSRASDDLSVSVQPTPRKDKEPAQERVVNLPSSALPPSETTVYLEDM